MANRRKSPGKRSAVDPVALIEFYLKARGEGQSELAQVLGKATASLVLNRKRPLTLDNIRRIKAKWPDLDTDSLIQEYETTG